MGSKSAAAEYILGEKPSSFSIVKPISSSAFNEKSDLRTSDESAVVENNAGINFPVAQVATSSVPAAGINFPIAQVATSSVPAALLVSQSTSTANKDAASKEPKATFPMLCFGDKVAPTKQSDAHTPTFGFASTNVGDFSLASGSSGAKLATSSDQKLENSNRLVYVHYSTFLAWKVIYFCLLFPYLSFYASNAGIVHGIANSGLNGID